MMKKFISILLTLMLLLSLTSPVFAVTGTEPKLVVSTETAVPGEEVTLTVSTENNPGIGVLTLGIIYDETQLELVGHENGKFTGWTVKKNAVWIGDEDSNYNGVILKLKFKVLDSATEGLTSVTMSCTEGDAYNYAEEPVAFACVSGGVNVHIHSYSAVVTAPTCTEMGYTTYTCSCGESYKDDFTNALGHKTEVVGAKDATCTEAGYTGDEVCTVCGDTIKKGETIPALGHAWDDGVITKQPTETENGIKTFTCTRCGETKTETIPALGHTHNYTATVTAPTCTEKGYTTHTCTCGDSYVDSYVDALGHDFGEWVETTSPTCTDKGTETRSCSRCDACETRDVDALGHDLIHHEGKAATCTEHGWEAYDTCSRCDYSSYKEIPAHGHNYETTVKQPTCTDKGFTIHTCTVCGYSYADNYVDALGHNTELVGAKDATCTEAGYTGDEVCTVCGDTIKKGETIPALGHAWDDGVITKQPTETENGIKTFTCTRCGETKTETIPPLGHTHEYTATVTAPTCTEKGYTTHTCACGDSYIDSYVDALGHSYKDGVCTVCGAKDPNYKPDIEFTDVDAAGRHAPFANAIQWAAAEGITTGYGDGIFAPDKACSRAQVVTFLWRAAGEPEPKSANNPFVDVLAKQANGKDNPYYTAILWAVEKGITLGVDSTHFAPDATVTRAQFVTFLWRYENKPEAKPGVTITDIDTVTNADFKAAILWAAGEGITTGYPDGTFRPNAVCTRAHVVTFIWRDMT